MRRLNDIARRSRRGFTLVELLVVVGIIAVLVSILLPVLGRAREQAQRTRCASNLRQFHMANEMYMLNDSKVWHLPGYWAKDPNSANVQERGYHHTRNWPGIYHFRKALDMPITNDVPANGTNPGFNRRCYVNREKWYCPTQMKDFSAGNDGPSGTTTSEWLTPMHYSYGMNVQGVDEIGVTSNPPALDTPTPPQVLKGFHGYHRSQVKRPAEKLMFVDAIWIVVNASGSGVDPGWNGANKVSSYDEAGDGRVGPNGNNGPLPSGRPYDFTRTTAWRHKGGANVCFFDGHVEWLHKEFIYKRDAAGNIVANMALWDVMK